MLTIIRGLPGSGKSTKAKQFAAEHNAILIEPDALMYDNGKYVYTKEKFRDAVSFCQRLIDDMLMQFGDIDIVYADVLPTCTDVHNIVDFAGPYQVISMPEITLEESMARNVHNVDRKDIADMIRQWEPWTPFASQPEN